MTKKTKVIGGIIIAIAVIIIVLVIYSLLSSGRSTYQVDSIGGYGPTAMDASVPISAGLGVSFSSKGKMAAVSEEASYDMNTVGNGIKQQTSDSETTIDRMVIKTGQLSVVVADVPTAVQMLQKYAVDQGGFVVSSEITKTDIAPYATVVIRVPVKKFDSGFAEAKKLGEVKSELVEGQDVTEEYVDLEARLKNLEATEGQFLEIMKKAQKIEDILAVQRELSYVRENIERIEGSMKYLRESASMSTITAHLSTDPEVLPAVDDQDKWKPWAVIKEASRSLVNLTKAFSYLIIWLIVYIPLWIIIFAIIWVVRRYIKKRKNI